MKFLIFLFYNAICQLVEVLPDEIETYYYSPNKHYVDYKYEHRIDFEDDILRHNGKVYYKDPSKYYGPDNTYYNLYENNDVKFLVNIYNIDSGTNWKDL